MENLSLSVIITTYNRKEILKKCLNALFNQTYDQAQYEIIVIDDGSTDGTEELVKSMAKESPWVLRYFKQEKKGPAAARNVGIKNANGKIALFIGDDIVAAPTLLEEHSKWHGQYSDNNVAVLGYLTWSPEIEITPFMRWLENGGPQFHFWQIKDKIEVDPQSYFYTSNISLKREFLLKNNGFFDENFLYAAYEDIELGYRLKRKGLILKYNKDAIAYHHHYTSLRSACRRMIKVGESRGRFKKKLEENQNSFLSDNSLLRKILNREKSIARYLRAKLCYPIAKFYEKRAIKGKIFGYALGYYLHIGARKYKREIG